MYFTKEQLGIIWLAINSDQNGNERKFSLMQLKDASSVLSKIKETCVDQEDKFIDGNLDFTTDEKKLIRDCTDREWPASVGLSVLEVREMLN
jgi:hypothetical protein